MERIRLDKHAHEIQLPKQLVEQGTLVVLSCCVVGLGERHTQGRRIQRQLGDDRGATTTGGLNRSTNDLTITDQLIKIDRASWDLGNGPIADGAADSNDIHLQEEVADVRRQSD